MAYQKLQVSNGLAVIPSDTVRIPNPDTEVLSGSANCSVPGVLTALGTTFLTDVKVGDIVYNTSISAAYYVASVTNDLQLAVTPSVAGGSSADAFVIYREATAGCVLFAGVAGDIGIQLAQQNAPATKTQLTFKGIAAGAFLPTQAVRVDKSKTTATDIIALW